MGATELFAKTELGAEAVHSHREALSPAARRLLILIDGQRDQAALSALLGSEVVDQWLPSLHAGGLIRSFGGDALQPDARPPQYGLEDESPAPESIGAPIHEARSARSGGTGRWLIAGAGALVVAAGSYWILDWRMPGSSASGGTSSARPDTTSSVQPAPPSANPAPPIAATAPTAAPAPIAPPASKNTAPTVAARSPSAIDKSAGGKRAAQVPTRESQAAAPAPAKAGAAPAVPSATAAITASARPVAPSTANPSPPVVAQGASSGEQNQAPAPSPLSAASAVAKPAPPQPAETAIRVKHREALDFPSEAARRGIETVQMVVHFRIAPDGTVEQVTATDVDPPDTFDARTRRALQRWTFEPPGRTLEKSIKITVHAGS